MKKYVGEVFTGITIIGLVYMMMQAFYFDAGTIGISDAAVNFVIGFGVAAIGTVGHQMLQCGEANG